MGMTKRLLEEIEEAEQIATKAALKAGNLKACEIHDIACDAGDPDMGHAYALASIEDFVRRMDAMAPAPKKRGPYRKKAA